ncbi:MAG: hypothetical protein H6868_05080 [Rhodospirillales bacterium]|nr:hypothetical protein [Rhodospirillales bacterium]
MSNGTREFKDVPKSIQHEQLCLYFGEKAAAIVRYTFGMDPQHAAAMLNIGHCVHISDNNRLENKAISLAVEVQDKPPATLTVEEEARLQRLHTIAQNTDPMTKNLGTPQEPIRDYGPKPTAA